MNMSSVTNNKAVSLISNTPVALIYEIFYKDYFKNFFTPCLVKTSWGENYNESESLRMSKNVNFGVKHFNNKAGVNGNAEKKVVQAVD